MRIWKAELRIFIEEGNWITRFNYELEDGDFELFEDNYICSRSTWDCDRIPVEFTVELANYGNGMVVSKGFKRELINKELKEVESEMKKALKSKIQKDRDDYLRIVDEQIGALR